MNDIPFLLFECNTSHDDNVICKGQTVILEENLTNIYSVSLITCSEYGAYSGELILNFEDNGTEKVNAVFPDMHHQIGSNYIWKGNSYDETFGRIEDAYLHFSEYLIESNAKLQKMILPNLPCSHIFGITIKHT
jgi:hypothetical protein